MSSPPVTRHTPSRRMASLAGFSVLQTGPKTGKVPVQVIDTLKHTQALEKAGMESQAAEAVVRAIAEAIEAEAPVTREYLDLRIAEVRKELAELRAEVQKDFRDQTWKVTATFVVVSLFATVVNHFWR